MAKKVGSSARRKETRKASYAAGETRKEARRKAQDARHRANLELVASGGVTAGGRTTWPRKRLHGPDKVAFMARKGSTPKRSAL